MYTLTEFELGYIAGFFDGEGCATLSIDKRKYSINCQVKFTNTDKEVLEWIQSKVGGNLSTHQRKNPKHKLQYTLDIQKNIDIIEFADTFVDRLILKGPQLEIVKYFASSRGKPNEETKKCDEKMISILRYLNKTGTEG